jgi:hypothetical protein
MKKIVLAALLLTSISSFAFSNGFAASNVIVSTDPVHVVPPAPVQKSFSSQFPAAVNVKWSVVSTPASLLWVADFYQGSTASTVKHVKAVFASDGTFLGKQVVSEP